MTKQEQLVRGVRRAFRIFDGRIMLTREGVYCLDGNTAFFPMYTSVSDIHEFLSKYARPQEVAVSLRRRARLRRNFARWQRIAARALEERCWGACHRAIDRAKELHEYFTVGTNPVWEQYFQLLPEADPEYRKAQREELRAKRARARGLVHAA